MESVKLPFIKTGSQVAITVSSGVVGDLQATLSHLIGNKSEEQMVGIQKKLDGRQQLDGWEIGVLTISRILRDIHTSAEQHQQVEYKEIADVITALAQ